MTEVKTSRPLRTTTPTMCAWCTSAATCEVPVPTPEMERRYGRQRYVATCDRHALLVLSEPSSSTPANPTQEDR